MEQQLQLLIREVLNVVAIISQLVSIHDTTWDFDGATEIEVVVALVESEFLKLLL